MEALLAIMVTASVMLILLLTTLNTSSHRT